MSDSPVARDGTVEFIVPNKSQDDEIQPSSKFQVRATKSMDIIEVAFACVKTATKLYKEGEVQVSSLIFIYTMGSEVENIFKSFTFATKGDVNKYDDVVKTFDKHFVPKKNNIHERARIHQRSQRQSGTVEPFVRSL